MINFYWCCSLSIANNGNVFPIPFIVYTNSQKLKAINQSYRNLWSRKHILSENKKIKCLTKLFVNCFHYMWQRVFYAHQPSMIPIVIKSENVHRRQINVLTRSSNIDCILIIANKFTVQNLWFFDFSRIFIPLVNRKGLTICQLNRNKSREQIVLDWTSSIFRVWTY